MSKSSSSILNPEEAFRRDLSLVLPILRAADSPDHARIGHRPADVAEAAELTAQWLRGAQRPAIVGLGMLTMEAVRDALRLARAVGGRACDQWRNPLVSRQPVWQRASLAAASNAKLMVGVGVSRHHSPAAERLGGEFAIGVDASLETVLALRDAAEQAGHGNDVLSAILAAPSVVVVLASQTDPRVIAQWHQLAASLQQRVRMAVVTLPVLSSGNWFGADSAMTWQTGISLAWGGVDFGSRETSAALFRDDADVLIDFRHAPKPSSAERHIVVGPTDLESADVHVQTDGLALGLAGHVMRFDGVMLRLNDPDQQPDLPDRSHEWLRRLLAALEASA